MELFSAWQVQPGETSRDLIEMTSPPGVMSLTGKLSAATKKLTESSLNCCG